MILRQSLNIFGKKLSLRIGITPEKSLPVYGFGNRCSDGLYVLFLDYDEMPLDMITEEIKTIQELYPEHLTDAYFFKTKHGYHVLFLDKHPLSLILDFMSYTTCDPQYRDVPMRYGRKIWVLRQSPKRNERIEYVGKVSQPLHYEDLFTTKSRAHAEWLAAHFPKIRRDLPKAGLYDDLQELVVGYYFVEEE